MFCTWCGAPEEGADHASCRQRLALVDPPRFCRECARRMIVQVTPGGWTARCSRHGESSSSDALEATS
ncbi:hypothetical protein [Amycolatopsis cihanbeyliensis]|uniref:Biotin synthase auxiliary protein n=1 Tax=Amycolatopsis cihanbeyliensis TaxID=1128664 RepID=A0A542DGC5_AMYCI|nr:hypothetical protein [Amycolatopsis cihanbeyliensis]TQJ02126.1 hypothetical protein FB471_1843 [Amycolatopsis cihanbeyliensis]